MIPTKRNCPRKWRRARACSMIVWISCSHWSASYDSFLEVRSMTRSEMGLQSFSSNDEKTVHQSASSELLCENFRFLFPRFNRCRLRIRRRALVRRERATVRCEITTGWMTLGTKKNLSIGDSELVLEKEVRRDHCEHAARALFELNTRIRRPIDEKRIFFQAFC